MTTEDAKVLEVTNDVLDTWATDDRGPAALYLKQKLLPVEAVDGEGGVIFPPTYADIGYNIDTLSDGTKVATIDSVGSQANRLEPIFKTDLSKSREQWLVPPIEIVLRREPCGECEQCKKAASNNKKKVANCTNQRKVKRSIFDLAHRAADAVVQSSPGLVAFVGQAFKSLQDGDAGPLCVLAPTSLIFGVWDSRGRSGEKRPRLVRSIIRAWDVEPLHAAAQFNSVWKELDKDQQAELKQEAKAKKTKLSGKGLNDAPATFRKVSTAAAKYMHEFRDGLPNAERRVLGGVLVRGRIEREVTVNLVALRGLRGANDEETQAIRKYLLGLSLMAATADIELFLREGCHLRYADGSDTWYQVPRRGAPTQMMLTQSLIEAHAKDTASHFRPKWPKTLEYEFNLAEAKKLLAEKNDEEEAGGGE